MCHEARESGCSCTLTWSLHLIIFVNNPSNTTTVKKCFYEAIFNCYTCLMALLTKIMRCILQVRAQEQPGKLTWKFRESQGILFEQVGGNPAYGGTEVTP